MKMKQKKTDSILNDFVRKSKERFGRKLVSVILFGSFARDTAHEYSDIDLMLVVRNLPKSGIKRHRVLSDIVLDFIEKYYVRISPILLEPSDLSDNPINPLVYGVLVGHKVIYDPENFWTGFLKSIKPVIFKTKPEYIEGEKRWRIETLI